jgi:hypothetical protein
MPASKTKRDPLMKLKEGKMATAVKEKVAMSQGSST